ncbi:uncharacterized protein BDW43DRAFT_23674 [Aspergillus alliaceus]|uniref:uncharacterized protein n=1 Tax=Petromyces alliaceus TaxID=209559 RepID=UPI0012A66F95|nr:uncharacterized protein BDW43DRAFT_23674 [Aspergillus alliaceus]KAB8235598.1 hypothetical protein BDW43DRAFT_23674 [Aspergillus alliaceus]
MRHSLGDFSAGVGQGELETWSGVWNPLDIGVINHANAVLESIWHAKRHLATRLTRESQPN